MSNTMKKNIFKKINTTLKNPIFTLSIGVVLILCGIFESVETTFEKILNFEIGLHHGCIIFGAFQVFHSIIIMLEGFGDVGISLDEKLLETEEKKLEK